MAQVAVVEDERAVREVVGFHLERAGLKVVLLPALPDSAALEGCDLLVLDWMLPSGSGLALLRRIRVHPELSRLPVLMLTARAGELDRVEGLESGADDYLTKPFSAAELVARVRALLRRFQPQASEGRLQNGPLSIDLDAAEVTLAGHRLDLTRREYDLLVFLARHPGRLYSRGELLDRVWGPDFLGGERTVDQHITQLRAHLGEDISAPRFLETVRGRGYRMRLCP